MFKTVIIFLIGFITTTSNVEVGKESKSIVSIWIDQDRYVDSIDSLSRKEKNQVLKDKNVQLNYLKINKMVRELARDIVNKGTNYRRFRKDLYKKCKAIASLKQSLKDSTQRGGIFNFSLDSPPKYIDLYIDIDKYDPSEFIDLRESQGKVPWGDIKRVFTIPKDRKKIKSDCEYATQSNHEHILLNSLLRQFAFIKSLNVRQEEELTYESFKDMLSDDVVCNLKDSIKIIKEDMKTYIDDIKCTVFTEINQNYESSIESIVDSIHDIHETHKNWIQENEDDYNAFSIVPKYKESDNYGYQILTWKVQRQKLGYIWNGKEETIFSFDMSIYKNIVEEEECVDIFN